MGPAARIGEERPKVAVPTACRVQRARGRAKPRHDDHMRGRFDGRVALVAGAAHGIGRAIATRLHSEGGSVALADLDVEAAATAAGQLGGALPVACDVTDEASVAAAVGACTAHFGGLDVLVCNVGIATAEDFAGINDAAWDRQVEPTLHGTVRCIQAALPHLLASRQGGNVVMTGSVNGLAAFGNVVYSMAKAGLGNLAANLSVRYGASRIGADQRPVRFNVVAPGTVRTRVWDSQDQDPDQLAPAYPLGRIGEPEDIAAAVAFLASDDASWITGVVLPVDGGVLCGPAQTLGLGPGR
jgi:NAD(P)-dependent dehydrogenase (short-subunit alcohol dehydrogenase family)